MMGRGHTNISFKYLDSKTSRNICRFLDKNSIILSPLGAYLIVDTTMNGKTINISPAKEAKIEKIIEGRGSKRHVYEFFDIRINLIPHSIKIGKIEYNIYREPQGD